VNSVPVTFGDRGGISSTTSAGACRIAPRIGSVRMQHVAPFRLLLRSELEAREPRWEQNRADYTRSASLLLGRPHSELETYIVLPMPDCHVARAYMVWFQAQPDARAAVIPMLQSCEKFARESPGGLVDFARRMRDEGRPWHTAFCCGVRPS
jgi:hypothetical protein